MHITYKPSDPKKTYLLPTFESLNVPKMKLSGFLEFIQKYKNLLYGESQTI